MLDVDSRPNVLLIKKVYMTEWKVELYQFQLISMKYVQVFKLF